MASKRNWSAADREATVRLNAAWQAWQARHPKVTQAQAAPGMGITQSALSQYLQGKVPMRSEAAFKIARFLGVDPRELRPDLEQKLARPHVAERTAEYSALPDEALDLARAWLSLPIARREFYRQTIWLEAVTRKLHPWLRFGKPDAERYADWEESMRQSAERSRAK